MSSLSRRPFAAFPAMELEWIKRLRERPGSELLGDDAAVLGENILTVDLLTEGVDFLLEETEPEWIGRKALAVNLSDLAAMGGMPTAVLVALALPRTTPDGLDLIERLYAGMETLRKKYGVRLAGGDTNRWDGGLVLSITALGRVTGRAPLRRSGGRANDVLLVTGPLGGSILEHQFRFEPRVFEALYLNENHEIHAAIDISDGLTLDLHRLAGESRLGATLEAAAIPISGDAVKLSGRSGKTPLEHALSDGEDFELLLAVPESEAETLLETQPLLSCFGTTLYRIGRLTDERVLNIIDFDGIVRPIAPKGFEH